MGVSLVLRSASLLHVPTREPRSSTPWWKKYVVQRMSNVSDHLKSLRKLLATAPGSKVWRQLVGVAASAEGLAPTRTSSGGSAVIIGLPSPTFPDHQIILTFCNWYGHFVPPMGGGCSFQVERVVLKLHKGPGAPVPGCKVGELPKTLEYDRNNDEDNNQICMSVKIRVYFMVINWRPMENCQPGERKWN